MSDRDTSVARVATAVMDAVETGVRVREGVCVRVRVCEGDCVRDCVLPGVNEGDDAMVGEAEELRVSDVLNDKEDDTDAVSDIEDDAVELTDDVNDAAEDEVGSALAVDVKVMVPEGVCADGETVDELVANCEQEPAGHTGGVKYGAAVTPRNTEFAGADASTSLTNLTVSYEYSVVGEVMYSMNDLHALPDSLRPTSEMMRVPDSINAFGGTARSQFPPMSENAAMLLIVVFAVSVIQTVVGEDHTNPYGLNVLEITCTGTSENSGAPRYVYSPPCDVAE